jgi:hypothetical protein
LKFCLVVNEDPDERRYVGDTQHLFSHIKQTILVEHLKYKHDGKETSFIEYVSGFDFAQI